MLAVDTNVLVYAADVDSPHHRACRDWLERRRARPDAWDTTWPIVYEFLRVTTHPRVLRRPWRVQSAWEFVSALLASPGLSVLAATTRHEGVASEVIAEMPELSGNLVHDAHIGSGAPIDTDKYFVISADTLANLNTKDPNVTTTGPASINPDTGKPYAMTFRSSRCATRCASTRRSSIRSG